MGGSIRKDRKSSRLEIEARLDKIEDMLCAGIGSGRIARTLATEYGLTPRQVRTYLSRVYERWTRQAELDAPHRREKVIRMGERFFARALSERAWTAAASVFRELARICAPTSLAALAPAELPGLLPSSSESSESRRSESERTPSDNGDDDDE